MKYLITILTALMTATISVGQYFTISEKEHSVKDGTVTSLEVIMKAKKDDAKGAWNAFVQDQMDIDVKDYGFFKKKDELYTEAHTIPGIENIGWILHSDFDETATMTHLNLSSYF
ncbi:MAG: hypothetical protein AAFQ02_05190 [Bacteroidota bacterium]